MNRSIETHTMHKCGKTKTKKKYCENYRKTHKKRSRIVYKFSVRFFLNLHWRFYGLQPDVQHSKHTWTWWCFAYVYKREWYDASMGNWCSTAALHNSSETITYAGWAGYVCLLVYMSDVSRMHECVYVRVCAMLRFW